MKTFYLSMLTVLTLLLGATSCSQEEGYEKPSSNVTSFSVSLNDVVGSRTVGKGTLADILYYEVFMGQTSVHKGYKKKFTSGTNIDLPLLNGETYQIVFWAQNSDCKIYELSDLSKISIDYDALQTDGKLLANQESYDAFYNALVDFQADGNTHKVELRRPFAQLNLGTTDWGTLIDALPANEVPVEVSSVTVDGLANAFYPLTGAAVANSNTSIQATFAYNQIPNAEFEVNGTKYKYLSLNYLLVPGQKDPQGEEDYVADTNEDKAIVDLTFNLKRGNTELRPISVPNAPMQRNWRTNIIGAVLTGTSFDITIEPATDGDNQDIRNIDGVDDLIDAMEANGDSENSVTYYVNGLSTLDEVSVAIPSTFKANDVTFIFNNIKNGANLEIKDAELAHKYAGSVYVKLPNLNETGKSLTKTKIDLGGAHVELLVGNFGETTAATDDLTLVVGPNATIGALVVEKGNVKIQTGGEVEKIINQSGGEVIVTLGENVEAPEVEGEGVDLKDANGDNFVAIGVSQKEGKDDTYYISNAEGLKWLASTTNNGDTFKGKKVMLAADIDLNNEQWTSAGTEANPFMGTFDGDGKTIMNLNIIETEAKEGKAYIGFFGYAKDATIKNVTFENVKLNIACLDIDHSQGHIGAVAGSLEGTSTIENVIVKGDIQIEATPTANGASRVAVVAGGNSYGDVTMKNVHVIANEGSYLKANNNTGALAGQLQGKNVFENCSSNINVTVNKFFAGGLIGIAAGDSQFTDCHTTGDVAVVAGRENRHNDEYRVGGIAGGWADGKTKVCTLTNCSYTGKVSGKNSDGSVAETLDYAGYVGRGYTLANCAGSKVIIDGVEYVQVYDDIYGIYTVNGVYEVGTSAALKAIATKVNAGESFEGETIKLIADIDLKDEEWTPIGSAANEHGFMANFDGNGKTIKNLKITEIALDSDYYAYAGLFGVTEGTANKENYIKNLTIENVNINTEGHIVSAAIAYPYYTTVENITVKGNITIKGGDYTSGVLAYTRRCVNAKDLTIEGNEGSSIEGKQTVGGVISDIQMNGGLKADYSNFAASGLTIKGEQCVGGISGIISQQTLDGATVKNVNIVCEDNRTGIVSGADGGKSNITNVSYENVLGAIRVIGATYDGGYYIGQILKEEGVKAIVYATEGGVKAVSVEELPLKGKNLSDATTWATSLGEGWALASIEELDAIHAARKTLNVALVADNTENVLFCETDYYTDGKYALYLSSTEATGNDPKGEAYFANRVHVKYFNLNGYWDYPLSTFATISIYAPLKDNYFARAVYTIGNKK